MPLFVLLSTTLTCVFIFLLPLTPLTKVEVDILLTVKVGTDADGFANASFDADDSPAELIAVTW